jgi:dephospho-CoA kinase
MGGVGSGKSAAARELARQTQVLTGKEVPIVDADRLGHEALLDAHVKEQIRTIFGDSVFDTQGQIDRKALGDQVFNDPERLRTLESLTHPWIRARAESLLAQANRDQAPLVVLDASLLLEARWDAICDHVVFVDTPDQERLRRVQTNRNWSEQEWRRREAKQLTLTQKRERADHVLENSTTLEHLSRQVADLLHSWGVVPTQIFSHS